MFEDLFVKPEAEPGFRLRVRTGNGVIRDVAVRLKLTGRMERVGGEWRYRCRIVFPGDGEPDARCSGWVYYRD